MTACRVDMSRCGIHVRPSIVMSPSLLRMLPAVFYLSSLLQQHVVCQNVKGLSLGTRMACCGLCPQDTSIVVKKPSAYLLLY